MLGLALAYFGCDPRSSDSLRGRRNFFWLVNNAQFGRFPVGNILWHFSTTMSISEAVKTFRTEFWKFYHKGSFFPPKRKKCLQNFHVLRLQAVITPQWLQIARNSLPGSPCMGCLVPFLPLESPHCVYKLSVHAHVMIMLSIRIE